MPQYHRLLAPGYCGFRAPQLLRCPREPGRSDQVLCNLPPRFRGGKERFCEPWWSQGVVVDLRDRRLHPALSSPSGGAAARFKGRETRQRPVKCRYKGERSRPPNKPRKTDLGLATGGSAFRRPGRALLLSSLSLSTIEQTI